MNNEHAEFTFRGEEDGGMTALGLVFFVGILIVGGLSLDMAFAYKSRTDLQVAADAAAHAAIMTRELGTIEEARAKAIEIAENTLDPGSFGDVLIPSDIQFGSWDAGAERFTVDNTSKDAVMVNTARFASRGNRVPAFLLDIVGFEGWNIQSGAVFETYIPTCFREGFTAVGVVDVQSNNDFTNGFCIHSNAYVKVSSNNTFGDDTVVSMPDTGQLQLPNSGFETNDGLAEALREGRYIFRILNRLADIIYGVGTGDPLYTPDYITNLTPVSLPSKNAKESDFVPGRIHTYSCPGGPALQIESGATLNDVVLYTSCKVKFGSDVTLDNVVIATTSSSAQSVTAASGLQVGRDDACAEDGGSQILTMGSISIPANLKVYGGQLIAMGDIAFSANANGVEGASFIAGGTISGTSNMTMGFCGSGFERNFEAQYFHLRG